MVARRLYVVDHDLQLGRRHHKIASPRTDHHHDPPVIRRTGPAKKPPRRRGAAFHQTRAQFNAWNASFLTSFDRGLAIDANF